MFCSVILEKNTSVPCSRTKLYGSVNDTQRRFKVSILQGEDAQPVKDCLVVGEKELDLPARKTIEPSIEVTIGYDESGMVRVLIKDLVSFKTEDITINFYATGVTKG
jgi:molecular chaperone DnaK (HSP70)